MNALFIGRFQPFHHGHLYVITSIMKEHNSIVIGIGSSQYSNTLENPFSYSERKEMITRVLTAASISSFQIESIPDIHDPPNWVDHVTKLVSDFNIIYTNNRARELTNTSIIMVTRKE